MSHHLREIVLGAEVAARSGRGELPVAHSRLSELLELCKIATDAASQQIKENISLDAIFLPEFAPEVRASNTTEQAHQDQILTKCAIVLSHSASLKCWYQECGTDGLRGMMANLPQVI
uniref:Uncharacterized protein n=1 Tax=Cryptomonas curvata TaxID=233186 RepID=A0A7S0QFH2_9CRYP